MCSFHQLYFSNEGYVVRCKSCDSFQIGFASTMLTLKEEDFHTLRRITVKKMDGAQEFDNKEVKSVILPTPYPGMKLLLSKAELTQFAHMLEQADSEYKAVELMRLFNNAS